MIVSVALVAFVCGCGGAAPQAATSSRTPQPESLTISGPLEVRGAASAEFSANAVGLTGTGVNWSVNGVSGGNGQVGTISEAGVYAAPLDVQTVTIGATSTSDATIKAAANLEVINPIPEITTAEVNGVDTQNLNLDIKGQGFIPQTQINVENVNDASTYVSPNEVQVQLPLAEASGSVVSVVASNPSPGASDSNVVTVALPPAPLNQLKGCSNPYNGPSTVDWGTSQTPVYIPLNTSTAPQLNPFYSSNTIFWVSRETLPGQAVLVTGAFTSSRKSVRVAPIPTGTQDWQTFVHNYGTVQTSIQQNSTGLSFKIPASMAPGVYGFEIDDPSTAAVFGMANLPQISWTMGVPTTTTVDQAFQAQFHNCGAEPGETLRVFGKNFSPTSRIVLESSSGQTLSLAPNSVHPTSMEVQVPGTLTPGNYYMWIGDLPWSSISSMPSLLTILAPRPLQVVQQTCTGLTADGKTNNSTALQSCMDKFAPPTSSGKLVRVVVPSGNYALSSEVSLHPYEILDGTSPSATSFTSTASQSPKQPWFILPQYSGLADLSIVAPGAYQVISSQDSSGNPQRSGRIYLSNLKVDSSPGSTANAGTAVLLSGPGIAIYNSTLITGTGSNLVLSQVDGAILSGNSFDVRNGLVGLESSQNLILEDNSFFADNGAGPASPTAISLGRPFCQFCDSKLSQNLYIAHNTFRDLGVSGNQVITEDGGGGAYYGTISSSTADTVVLGADPSWSWTGNSDPGSLDIVIVSGTGVGQHASLKAVNGRTLVLSEPWKIPPDESSWVVVVFEQRNLDISRNSFANTLGMTVNVFDAIGAVIEDNALTNSGNGVRISAYGPYGGPAGFGQLLEVDVLRNELDVGVGTMITPSQNSNIGGIGVMQGYGSIVSGAMIRQNAVTDIQSIYATNGTTGISAVVIDDNQANWVGPVNSVPGYLSEDNVTP